ncbi:MAG: dihydroneopterin aldolase [Litoreibacter sp.]
MTNDIKLAFDHPVERAAATANSDVPLRDRISLRDHIREVDIGAFQAERGITQRICFNIVVEVGVPESAVANDDVDQILSYDSIAEAIDRELSAERLNLLETLAVRIAEDILSQPLAARVFVRIEKLDRGSGALGVEIMRDRAQIAPTEVIVSDPPCVLFLEHEVVHSEGLSDLLDNLAGLDLPLILCVGLPGENPPQAAHRMAQRRIDLLAIEQNAWILAARDRRCVVVSTRTELDWAMKNGQISVWAPSKIILDTTDSQFDEKVDAVSISRWFSEEFEARKLVNIDSADSDFETISRQIIN